MDIKKIRTKALLTQEQFARVLGVAPITIYSWEHGIRNPSMRQQWKIKKFCEQRKIEFNKE